MKRFKHVIIIAILACFLLTSLTGCYGKFALTKKLYKWNGTIGEKHVRSLVMWILMWIPAYEACGFIDFAVLNLIEFWTGSNPLAMNDTQQEIKYYTDNGINYKVITSKNRYDIYDLNNPVHNVSFVYNTANENWMLEKDGKQITIVDQNRDFVKFFDLKGKVVKTQSNM